jgi:hypothetical protein
MGTTTFPAQSCLPGTLSLDRKWSHGAQIYLDDSRAHVPCQGGVHIATTLGHSISQRGGWMEEKAEGGVSKYKQILRAK